MGKHPQKHITINKNLFIFSFIFLLLQSCSSDSSNNEKPLMIGDEYQGGIIFLFKPKWQEWLNCFLYTIQSEMGLYRSEN